MTESLKDARILILDDKPLNVEILENLLTFEDYSNFKSLTDSTKAFNEISAFKPHLILLDLMMPVVSGYDLLIQLKNKGLLNGKLKVLVLTADATNEAKKKCLENGAHDFLTKPFDMTETALRIKNLLYSAYLFEELEKNNDSLEDKIRERTEDLQRSTDFVKKQNKALKEITWIQSHLVRAPVSRIMGLSDILSLEESEDFSHKEIIQQIVNSCKELDSVIRDISKIADDADITDSDD